MRRIEFHFKKKILYCFLVMLFSVPAACARREPPARYLDEGENHLVRLEKGPPSAAYSHPAELDLAVWEKALRSIVVSHPVPLLKRIFIQKDEIVGRAFTSEEAEMLAERFKEAAALATPEEHIAFFLTGPESHLSIKLTSGIAFVREGALHLIFANHQTEVSMQRHPYAPRETALRSYDPDSFKLRLQPHHKKLTGVRLERGQEGLSVDYASVETDVPGPSPEKGSEPSRFDPSKVEERLQFLKKLRDEALISEQEYLEKKRELLKSLDVK